MRTFLVFAFLTISGGRSVAGQDSNDWPHWRGPARNDVIDVSSGWNGEWRLKEVWRGNVAEGSSSPLAIGDRLYSFGWKNGKEEIVCLDANTGKKIWGHSYPCPKYGRNAVGDQGLFSGPSSTPEFDVQTGFLYTLGSDGNLRCWNTQKTGEMVWEVKIHDRFTVRQRPKVGRSGRRDYGWTSSPLIHKEQLVVEVGAQNGNLVAFDKKTGKTRWISESKSPAGHNGGPVPIQVQGIACVAVHNHDGLLVARLDPNNAGETVAQIDWETSFANNIATPAVFKNSVIMTSAYNQNRIARYDISLNGATKIWEQKLASKVCSPVVVDDHVYIAWQEFKCLDWKTGEPKWQGGRAGDPGSLIATSDHRLIGWTGRGTLSLIDSAKLSPGKFRLLASQVIFQQTDAWPHLVHANGYLYCKDRQGNLRCLELPGK